MSDTSVPPSAADEPQPESAPVEAADQPTSIGSTDASLAGKERSGRPRWGLWAGLVVVIALVVGIFVVIRPGAAAGADSTLTVGLTLEPTNLDIRTTTGAALEQVLIDNVYRPVVSRAADGTIKPAVASQWTVSPDALTYTFTIPAGQVFSNGDPLTAETAATSINSVITNKYRGSEYLGSVKSVAASDANTLVVTLSKPYPDLLWALSGRAGLVLDPAATNDLKNSAIGSGPFLLSGWKQGDSITLVRNDKFSGTKARVGKVVFRYLTDTNAAANALKAGDLDVLAPIDATLAPTLPADKFATVRGAATDKFVLAFNNAAAPLNNLKVRQAIRYAIDHQAIIAARGGVDAALGGPIPEGDPGYEDLTGLYPHDVAKAKALLAEAGYPNGLKLTLTIPSFYGDNFGNLLTSQLAQAGITLKVNAVEFPTWLTDVYTNHNYELSIVDHAEGHDFGSWANPKYYFGYNNAEAQKLYAESQETTTAEKSDALLAQAAKIVSTEAAADWLVNFRTVTAIRKGVEGFPTDQINNRLNLADVTVSKA